MGGTIWDYALSEVVGFLAANALQAMLGIAIIGGVLFFLWWKRHAAWAWGGAGVLAVATMLVVVQTGIKTQRFFVEQRAALQRIEDGRKPSVTKENVMSMVESWAKRLRHPIKVIDDADSIIAWEITTPTTPPHRLVVQQSKNLPDYLNIVANLAGGETEPWLAKIPPRHWEAMTNEIHTHLTLLGLQYSFRNYPRVISMWRTIPIGDELTEHTFAESVLRVNSSRGLVDEVIERHLRAAFGAALPETRPRPMP